MAMRTGLERLVARMDVAQRIEAASSLAGDIEHWASTSRIEADRLLAYRHDIDPVGQMWADAELFTFALASVRRGLAAAVVLCDDLVQDRPFSGILHTFDRTVPDATKVRDRITHFDEWGLKPGGNVSLTQMEAGEFIVHVGTDMNIDVATATAAAQKSATTARNRLLRLWAEDERRARP